MMKITGFEIKGFRGSNALWNYVMDNASLRSYIAHHDQSGLSRPNHKEQMGENNKVRNNGFSWVQLLWDYMVVKASLRS